MFKYGTGESGGTAYSAACGPPTSSPEQPGTGKTQAARAMLIFNCSETTFQKRLFSPCFLGCASSEAVVRAGETAKLFG